MRCIEITEFGGPEVLRPAERETPEPGAGQVLIRVAAAGINRPDVIQRLGFYPPPPGAPDIPGLEVAGEVVERDDSVKSLNKGDMVCALVAGGGYAEYCAADASLCLPIPEGMSPVEAAAIPETFFTVWSNVFDRAGLTQGETFLVHGGSSGIGTTAIQLGRTFGARVFITAGNDEKCEACLALGAELAINYNTQDFVAECRTATGDRGVDVILDMVAGDYAARNIEVAAPDARIVIIATLGGHEARLDLRRVMMKRLVITGSTLRPRPLEFKADIARKLHEHVWPFLANGTLRPVIYKTLPLEDAAQAHQIMESGAHIGKIMLTTGD